MEHVCIVKATLLFVQTESWCGNCLASIMRLAISLLFYLRNF